ncbi:MAG: TIGR04086 family membrane protein [Acutalibacteraceae bacterium]
MGKDTLSGVGKKGYLSYIKGLIVVILVTALFLLLFAFVMYLLGGAAKYAPVFATLSAAFGGFAGAFTAASSKGSKGWLTGAVIGGIVFIVITLVSLIINRGGVTLNTLFHFIIIMLSSLIGGITGVNRGKSHKYI